MRRQLEVDEKQAAIGLNLLRVARIDRQASAASHAQGFARQVVVAAGRHFTNDASRKILFRPFGQPHAHVAQPVAYKLNVILAYGGADDARVGGQHVANLVAFTNEAAGQVLRLMHRELTVGPAARYQVLDAIGQRRELRSRLYQIHLRDFCPDAISEALRGEYCF